MGRYRWLLISGHGKHLPERKRMSWPGCPVFYEGEFNRAIVARLIKLMTAARFDFVNIVPETEDVSRVERVRRANAIADDSEKKCLLISVHSNKGGGSGCEVFTSPGETASDSVATVFFEQLEAAFPGIQMRSDRVDGDPDKEAKFTVLTASSMPAVLLELFFYDNEQECKEILMTEKGRDKLAMTLFLAIIKIENNGIGKLR